MPYTYNPLISGKLDIYIPESDKDTDGGLFTDIYINTADVDGGSF